LTQNGHFNFANLTLPLHKSVSNWRTRDSKIF